MTERAGYIPRYVLFLENLHKRVETERRSIVMSYGCGGHSGMNTWEPYLRDVITDESFGGSSSLRYDAAGHTDAYILYTQVRAFGNRIDPEKGIEVGFVYHPLEHEFAAYFFRKDIASGEVIAAQHVIAEDDTKRAIAAVEKILGHHFVGIMS